MSVTIIVTVKPNPNEGEAMQEYSANAGPLLGAAGGQLIKRIKVSKPIVGNVEFAMSMMMDFPSLEAAEGVFNSIEYKALIPLRDKGFDLFDVAVGEEF